MSSAQRAADRTRIAQIEAEISNLQDMIERLRDEKAVAEERLNSYHYPALTLATELVSEIFTHCLPVYPLAPPLEGPTSPTIFTEICRHWRDIALATPGLWCAFRLENTHYRQRQLQTVIMKAWLDRSGCRPLSIQMDLLRYYPDVALVRALVRERSRWEYVRLRVLLEQLPSDSAMPHLRHLELKSLTLHPQLPIAFQPHQIPSLHTVTLWDWTYPSGFLPWSQLRSLSLIGKEPEECAPILTQTVNLVHCELVLFNDHEATPLPDVHLPHLRSLVLGQFQPSEPHTAYLQAFVVPALRCLQIPDSFLTPDPIAACCEGWLYAG